MKGKTDEIVECASPPCFGDDTWAAHERDASSWPTPPEGVPQWRRQKRGELLATRLAVSAAVRARMAVAVAATLDELIPVASDTLVSVYWPFKGEFNLRDWMESAWRRGARSALPVVVRKAAPLVFREWTPEARLFVEPNVVIAPLVGFDECGFRLGYGGGFFDRTLAALAERERHPTVIGVGMTAARLDTIHPLPHDIPMHTIVTESGVVEIEPASGERK